MNVGVWMGGLLIFSSIVWAIVLFTMKVKGSFAWRFWYQIVPFICTLATLWCGNVLLYAGLVLAGGNI